MKKNHRKRRAIPKESNSKTWLNLVIAAMLLIYLVTAVALDLLFPSELNTEFSYAFTYVSLPAAALAYLLVVIYQAINSLEFGFLETAFYTGAFWLMLTLCAGGYAAAYNASVGEQTVCPIEGKVVGRFTTSGRHGGFPCIEVFDPRIGRTVTIRLTEEENRMISTGDRYKTEMIRGSLGLYYPAGIDK